jgi:hypothetical protein
LRPAHARGGAVLLSALLVASAARAEGNVVAKVGAETSAYQDTTATSVLTPTVAASVGNPTAGWSANGRYLVDIVSAASPDIVATASRRWTEVRQAASLGGGYKPRLTGFNAGANFSYTPDYLSIAGSLTFIQDFDDKNATLTASYGLGHDTIGRTGTPFSLFSRDLTIHSGSVSLSRVINRSAIFSATADLMLERGDQSKPYRYIPLFTREAASQIGAGASKETVAQLRSFARPLEQLPLGRERYALTGRLAWRPSFFTLRLEERLYADSWAQKSTSTDARFLVDMGSRVTFWPHVRFHYQSAVSFWQRAYVSSGPADIPKLRTGDRELGELFNTTGGLGVRFGLGSAGEPFRWALSVTADGVWSRFLDTLYVKYRLSALGVVNLEAEF